MPTETCCSARSPSISLTKPSFSDYLRHIRPAEIGSRSSMKNSSRLVALMSSKRVRILEFWLWQKLKKFFLRFVYCVASPQSVLASSERRESLIMAFPKLRREPGFPTKPSISLFSSFCISLIRRCFLSNLVMAVLLNLSPCEGL